MDLPSGFHLFPFLPPEIRHKVWEAHLTDPGVNFLKVEPVDGAWNWGSTPPWPGTHLGDGDGVGHGVGHQNNGENDIDDVDRVLLLESQAQHRSPSPPSRLPSLPTPLHHPPPRARPWPMLTAELVASNPNHQVDISNYVALYKRLAILCDVDRETDALTRSLWHRPKALRLGNGNIVALQGSPDLVCLEYLPPQLFNSDGNLDFQLDCPGLDSIKRAAVKFSPIWHPKVLAPKGGADCAKPDEVLDRGRYPAHLYQLLARHFPKLEEFYLIDYFIVKRKDDDEMPPPQREQPSRGDGSLRKFRARGRLFHEMSSDGSSNGSWKMDPKTRGICAWLRESFVRYANGSSFGRHESPETVRFGILACDWSIPVPCLLRPRPGPTIPGHRKPTRPRRGAPSKMFIQAAAKMVRHSCNSRAHEIPRSLTGRRVVATCHRFLSVAGTCRNFTPSVPPRRNRVDASVPAERPWRFGGRRESTGSAEFEFGAERESNYLFTFEVRRALAEG
ncbi:hypothetical protein DCS_08121 [Drechmeria coniospora]|uniref:2EXR domain-containing protein n=1 Tax=Drechmeria coniospora TaxID=98403 RepID=A0A151GGE1_DRECN|nr:hypothetical protein DCS_08121 [Drechmeria coniospora]KYK56154.1 hypothetical protein DCS_08121 [Drechmeria coniospora]